MPRPTIGQPVYPSQYPTESPGTEVKEAWFYVDGFTGFTTVKPEITLPRTVSVDIFNAGYSSQGRLEAKAQPGNTTPTPNNENVVGIYPHHNKTNTRILYVTTAGVYTSVSTISGAISYNQLTGPTLDLASPGAHAFVSWTDDIILFSCQQDYIIAIDLSTQTYSRVTSGPYGAGHISLINGRLAASNFDLTPRRVYWSVKFNYEDWAGLGAGFEDLLASQYGGVNPVWGVYALGDVQGIVVRQHTFDVVQATDNFDAPFRFQTRHRHKLTYYPRSVAVTTNSIIVACARACYEVTLDSIVNIGLPIETVFTLEPNPSVVIGTYNVWQDSYMLAGFQTGNILVYSCRFKGWYRLSGVATYSAMAYIGGLTTKPYAALTGTYASQTGTLDTWGSLTLNALDFTIFSSGSTIYRLLGTDPGSAFSIQLPKVEPTQPNRNITVLSVHVGYQNPVGSANTTLTVFSRYLGSNTTYGSGTVVLNAITEPAVINIYNTLTQPSFSAIIGGSGSLLITYVLVRYTESETEVTTP